MQPLHTPNTAKLREERDVERLIDALRFGKRRCLQPSDAHWRILDPPSRRLANASNRHRPRDGSRSRAQPRISRSSSSTTPCSGGRRSGRSGTGAPPSAAAKAPQPSTDEPGATSNAQQIDQAEPADESTAPDESDQRGSRHQRYPEQFGGGQLDGSQVGGYQAGALQDPSLLTVVVAGNARCSSWRAARFSGSTKAVSSR